MVELYPQSRCLGKVPDVLKFRKRGNTRSPSMQMKKAARSGSLKDFESYELLCLGYDTAIQDHRSLCQRLAMKGCSCLERNASHGQDNSFEVSRSPDGYRSCY